MCLWAENCSCFYWWKKGQRLTHLDWMTHICVNKLAIIGSDNGLVPSRHQATIRTNVRILLVGPLGTNFSEILIEIYIVSFKKMHFLLEMAAIFSRAQCVEFICCALKEYSDVAASFFLSTSFVIYDSCISNAVLVALNKDFETWALIVCRLSH